MDLDLVNIISSIGASKESIKQEVDELRAIFPNMSKDKLSYKFCKTIRNRYTEIGVVSAFPSAIPGLGTAVQLAMEAGTITGDLYIMLRWMYRMCVGVAYIYGRDSDTETNKDMVRILGRWCGVVKTAQPAVEKIGQKVAIKQFSKIPAKIFQRINQKVGATIITKYGAKRGSVALGKLVPFGVGALIAGGFNYFTFRNFAKRIISFYDLGEDQREDILICK